MAMVNVTFDQILSGYVTKKKAKRSLTNGGSLMLPDTRPYGLLKEDH